MPSLRCNLISKARTMLKKPAVDKVLLTKYFNNQCTDQERQVVLDWLSNPENKLLAHEAMKCQWDDLEHKADPAFELEKILRKTQEKAFGAPVLQEASGSKAHSFKNASPFSFWKMAAVWSGILILFFSMLILLGPHQKEKQVAEDSQTRIKSSSGEVILKVLSDGTKVWLNAESSVSFPTSFKGDSIREVWLSGEAFFDVAEDKKQPFIVRTKNIDIRVLGTAFNVKSYDGDSTVKTTLVRGKVVVRNKHGKDKVELRPNQQAVFSHLTEQITLRDVHAEKHTSWNSGSLVFEDDSLYDVIKSLERWYGIAIHLRDKSNLECRLTARIDKESLVETLEILKSLTGIRYSVKEKDVYIEGKICEQ